MYRVSKIRRPMVRIERTRQADLFGSPPCEARRRQRAGRVTLIDPDPEELSIGNVSLKRHLETMGIRDPFIVRDVLSGLDYTAFIEQYQGGGRAAYSPRGMVGIVLYGLMRGVNSLRGLERFSRTDLGCWWISGGITPDHSVLGRFVQRHEAALHEVLFSAVVTTALKRTGTSGEDAAGDGTVIEAMSSRYGVLRGEALAREAAQLAEVEDSAARARREQLQRLQETLQSRRRASGHRDSYRGGHPREAEATVLKQKGGGYRLSYAPVVLANPARIALDGEVSSGAELQPMVALMCRSEAQRLSLDNGFMATAVLEAALARDLDLLVAPKSSVRPDGRFRSEDYHYLETEDAYLCPAGQHLRRVARSGQGVEGAGYDRYANPAACSACTLRARCTRRSHRTIQRTRATMLREIMTEVMAHKQARARYARHKAWVEPVFSVLRLRQGLNRFRRRGLAGVRLEFRLHLMAYNLSRIVAWVLRAWLRAKNPGMGLASGWRWLQALVRAISRPGPPNRLMASCAPCIVS